MSPNNEAKATLQHSPLTERQAQVFELLAQGETDRSIAATLNIGEETVAEHLRVMFRKHNVHCRAALVAKLLRLDAGPRISGRKEGGREVKLEF